MKDLQIIIDLNRGTIETMSESLVNKYPPRDKDEITTHHIGDPEPTPRQLRRKKWNKFQRFLYNFVMCGVEPLE